MVFPLKCGTGSYFRAAMTVAVIDIIYTAFILIMFVLGTSLMVGFEFTGSPRNASRVLDDLTDQVFGEEHNAKSIQDVAEDLGIFLIIMFLSVVDFIISCIFLDGIKSRNAYKCQAWFNIRLVILVIFDIIVFINVLYGSSWYRCIPDAILTVYRLVGILIGYAYLQELHSPNCSQCVHSNCNSPRPSCAQANVCLQQRHSVVNLSGRRKEVQKALQDMPIVTVTGPDEPPTQTFIASSPKRSRSSSGGNVSPQVSITRKISTNSNSSSSSGGGGGGGGIQKATILFPEPTKDKAQS